MIVAFEIIIDVVFRIEIAVVFVFGIIIYCEGPKLNPAVRIIIVVIDKTKGPIIMERRIMVVVVKIIINVVFGIIFVVVFEIVIVVAVVRVVKDPALSCLVLPLDVRIIIV